MALAKEETSTTAITHNTRSPSTAITTTVVSQETIAFSGKLDDVYTELNNKFETLNIHVKKLETQGLFAVPRLWKMIFLKLGVDPLSRRTLIPIQVLGEFHGVSFGMHEVLFLYR
ncbi:hypothetical protein F2Q70_00003757 [Brassica cretica]|uniref:Uncharacterized protein n=1 Tax=Brassica cretica TaxID=69181 RepID=A0A8S9ITQ2_BRACR|nr:hypothetical protein F2Q70_00003757 [Brassica cretica]KAF3564871.1 hypothetical protein DY000_02015665 [Brassica cretica]